MFGIKNYTKYGVNPSSHDFIKFLAIIIMVIDHSGSFFFPEELWFRAIGRIGFPIWFFLAGYARPSKLGYEIVVLSVLMIIADAITHNTIFPVNALVSIMACRFFVFYLAKQPFKKGQSLFYFIAIAICAFLLMVIFEYGSQALLFALFGYLVKTQPKSMDTKISSILAVGFFLTIQLLTFDFDIIELLVMAAGTGAIAYYLYNFTLEFYSIKRGKYATPLVMYFARNSLYIYFIHFIAFVFIEWCLHPEKHEVFLWI